MVVVADTSTESTVHVVDAMVQRGGDGRGHSGGGATRWPPKSSRAVAHSLLDERGREEEEESGGGDGWETRTGAATGVLIGVCGLGLQGLW